MLLSLWRRDALLNGRMLFISYGLFAGFQMYFVVQANSARAWMVFASIYAAFLAITIFAREDKFQSTAWTCTLPITRAQLVQARFLGSWAMAVASLLLALAVAAVMPGSRVAPASALEAETLLLAATTVTLVVGLMLPFLIRFGLSGVLIFLVAAQLLGAGLLLVAVASRNRGGGGVRLGFSVIADAVRAAHQALPATAFDLIAVAILVALNWAGYRLALALFRRREL